MSVTAHTPDEWAALEAECAAWRQQSEDWARVHEPLRRQVESLTEQLQGAVALLALYREYASPDLTRMVEYEAKIAARHSGEAGSPGSTPVPEQ